MSRRRWTIVEVTRLTGLNEDLIATCLENEWLRPADNSQLDDEDVARLRLIAELRHQFGVNDEGIPVILHLLDQLFSLRSRLCDRVTTGPSL